MAPIRAVIPQYSKSHSNKQQRCVERNQFTSNQNDYYINGSSDNIAIPLALPIRAITIKDFSK